MGMCDIKLFLIIIVITTFIFSIIYIYNIRLEGMKIRYDCPSKLEETNEGLFKLSYEDNKKPPKFYYSLDEYVELITTQKDKSMNCPILNVGEHSDLNPLSLHPSKETKIQLLLDANRDDNVYNINQYPGYDPNNLYIGIKTPLDLMDKLEENKNVSANPMDSNWGGNAYTENVVNSGFYEKNTR
jgi:hypothetical protein